MGVNENVWWVDQVEFEDTPELRSRGLPARTPLEETHRNTNLNFNPPLTITDRNRIEAFEMWCWRKMLSISWQEHRTNDSILTEFGLERVNGKSGKAETTIFWPHYSGKCRTVGTYSPRRNHGRFTVSRQIEKTVDTRH